MKSRLLVPALLGAVSNVITSTAFACSPVPPKIAKLPDGTITRVHADSDYVVVAEILGEVPSSAVGQKGEPTTGLRVRVLETSTARASPGDELNLFAYYIGGAACQLRWGVTLATTAYPIGTRVRVSTNSLTFPYWERQYRLVRLK